MSSDLEHGSAKKGNSIIESEIYLAGGGRSYQMARTGHYSKRKKFWRLFRGETNTYRLLMFLDDFLETYANIYLRKLLVVPKETENIQLGNAELKRKGKKC
jgi:hypothetical protein